MIPRLLLAVLLLAPQSAPAPASAQPQAQATQEKPVCPWLTEGTATATLGAPATTAITLHGDPDHPEGTCTFTTPAGYVLEIAVSAVTSTPPEPACPANALKLPGIGNEATFCHTENRDRITSHVRDLSFRITLSTQPGAPPPDAKQQEAHQQQLERVAEQVAGNLF